MRLLLVFWPQILVSVVILILAAIIRDFGYVLVRFFRSIVTESQNISHIDLDNWGRVFLILFMILLTLFLLFSSFLKGLYIISILRSCYFLNSDLRFFNPKVFQFTT